MTNNDYRELVVQHKRSGFNWRERRHPDWLENYMFYRDKVIINRLTQRQSVNLPLMKSAIHTLMKDIDDAPLLFFKSLDNDEQKEVYYNEYWKDMWAENRGTIKDIVDKKQVMLFGRSFKKLNIVNGLVTFEIIDPQDVLVDRYVDPTNLDTARFLIHQHIYKPLSSLGTMDALDQDAVKRLQKYYLSEEGLLKSEENAEDMIEKNQRMEAMGVQDMMTPELGEAYVELNEAYIKVWNEKLQEDEIIYIIIADEREVLLAKPLQEVIGETVDSYWLNHFPYTTWGADVERTDFWSDAPADTLRTPNKVLNSWMSQLIENRTLRNYGMQFYNASVEGFVPQTYDPGPFAWIPVPGKPSEVMQRVDIPDLSESLDEMSFVMSMAEKASAATAANQGQVEKNQVTLGEVQLALNNAKERVKSFSIMYTESWNDFGRKYIKLLEAADSLVEGRRVFRKGRHTEKMYSKYITPEMWHSDYGFKCEVKQKTDMDAETVETIQKLQAARGFMPMNKTLDAIIKEKALDFANIPLEQKQAVLEEEKVNMQVQQQMLLNQGSMTPQEGEIVPEQPAMPMTPEQEQVPQSQGRPMPMR